MCRWFIGFFISIGIALIVLIILPDNNDVLGFCIVLIGLAVTACYSAIKTIRRIRELKNKREQYSKTEWVIIERRILGIEMFVIADIAIALMCIGACVYEALQVFN